MAATEIATKKYVVRSGRGERSPHEALIRKRSNLAWRLLKARILLKVDVPEAGRVERQLDHRGSDNHRSQG